MENLFTYLFLGGLVLLAILSIAVKIYNCFSHTHYEASRLRSDAKIVSVQSKVVGAKNSKKYRTTVLFDDGFTYESHKTDRENGIFSYRIQVTEATKREIIDKALQAHRDACAAHPDAVNTARKPASAQPQKAPAPQMRTVPPRPKTPQKEFMEVLLQTMGKPAGSEEEAWSWIAGRIRYFQEKGIDRNMLWTLEQNVIVHLPNSYRAHFGEFLALAQSMIPVYLACEQLLKEGKGQAAKDAADPWLNWLLAHPEKYRGHYCVQNREEPVLCQAEGIRMTGTPTEENYTAFLLLYCRILDNLLMKTEDARARARKKKEEILDIAQTLSPCNAAVWEALARIVISPSEDEQLYQTRIRKALHYSVQTGEPDGLGAVYGNLAMHYATTKPALAKALCAVCRRYEGNPIAAELVLSRQNIPTPADPDALLQGAGIPIGFSPMVLEIQKSHQS